MNISLNKNRKFAVRIYTLYKYLCDEKREYVLAKQLLRSGTSKGYFKTLFYKALA